MAVKTIGWYSGNFEEHSRIFGEAFKIGTPKKNYCMDLNDPVYRWRRKNKRKT